MPKSVAAKPVDQLSYEVARAELESIVATLEGEQRSLDESMALYERGQALAARCAELLEQAALKVRELSAGLPGDPEADE